MCAIAAPEIFGSDELGIEDVVIGEEVLDRLVVRVRHVAP